MGSPTSVGFAALSRSHRSLPVLFTELGYTARQGTARTDRTRTPARSTEEAQAIAYEAAFEALSPLPYFQGIWWWEWSAEGLGIGPDRGHLQPGGQAGGPGLGVLAEALTPPPRWGRLSQDAGANDPSGV